MRKFYGFFCFVSLYIFFLFIHLSFAKGRKIQGVWFFPILRGENNLVFSYSLSSWKRGQWIYDSTDFFVIPGEYDFS